MLVRPSRFLYNADLAHYTMCWPNIVEPVHGGLTTGIVWMLLASCSHPAPCSTQRAARRTSSRPPQRGPLMKCTLVRSQDGWLNSRSLPPTKRVDVCRPQAASSPTYTILFLLRQELGCLYSCVVRQVRYVRHLSPVVASRHRLKHNLHLSCVHLAPHQPNRPDSSVPSAKDFGRCFVSQHRWRPRAWRSLLRSGRHRRRHQPLLPCRLAPAVRPCGRRCSRQRRSSSTLG